MVLYIDVQNLIIITAIIIISLISFYLIVLFTKKIAKKTELAAEQMWRNKNKILLDEMKKNFSEISSQNKSYLEQIELLKRSLENHISETFEIEKEKIIKFDENLTNTENLIDEYTILADSLHDLLIEDQGIVSPEILHKNMLKEMEITQKLSRLSNQIQPLLKENIEIIHPFIKEKTQ
jgi:hypothetical protein